MTTRDELLSRFNEGIERRAVGIASISRYFDSVIAPIEKLMTTHLWTDYEVNFSVAGDALDLLKFFRIMRANGFVPDNRPDDNKPSFNTYFRLPDGTVVALQPGDRQGTFRIAGVSATGVSIERDGKGRRLLGVGSTFK